VGLGERLSKHMPLSPRNGERGATPPDLKHLRSEREGRPQRPSCAEYAFSPRSGVADCLGLPTRCDGWTGHSRERASPSESRRWRSIISSGTIPGSRTRGPFAVSAAIIIAVAALLFAGVVRRSLAPRRAPLVVAIAAVLSLALIWLGLPFAVAPAAIALGLRGHGTVATAAIAVGTVILLLATGAYVSQAVDKLS